MGYRSELRSWLRYSLHWPFLKANYWLNNYEEIVWVIGDGRSGTTWLSDIVSYSNQYRAMFEPFHPAYVKAMRFLSVHHYQRPGASNEPLFRVAKDVFTGRFTHIRVDADNRSPLYQGLLVKDIFANLFAYWMLQEIPRIRIVLLLRNPFAVALSKSKKRFWKWPSEPLDLLNQPDLVEDHLSPYQDLFEAVSRSQNFLLQQILIWCSLNYVPIRQFKEQSICIVIYENLYANPVSEVNRIMQFVRPNSEVVLSKLDRETVLRPSKVSGKESNLVSGASPITSWKDELPASDIDAGYAILQRFGFDGLYDNRVQPQLEALERIRSRF